MFVALGTNDVAYIEDQPFDDWRKVMIANLDTHWLACQAAGRQFAKQPDNGARNKVVVVSSTRVRLARAPQALAGLMKQGETMASNGNLTAARRVDRFPCFC